MYWYILAAVLDVEANFLVLLAYNYTTITSVMLLDCFTIPCAMVLSYLFLGCRYNYKHMLGTGICLLGLVCIVINDSTNATDDDAPAGSNPVLGDILCLSAAVLYASSNVLQEHLVKFHDREEFLGYLGCFGFGIAVVQCVLVDLPAMRRANFTGKVIGAISGFVICLFLMYTNTTAFLQHGDAVLFNLSLLTSDVYAVVFTYFFSGYLVSWLYFVAFALVIVGLVLYHSQPAPLHIGRDFGDVGLFTTIQHSPCGFCCRDAEERRVGYHGVQGEESSHHPAEAAYCSVSQQNKAVTADGTGPRSHPARREPGSPGMVATMQYSPIVPSNEEQP
jgi:solute carrier family 35 protein F1/2